MKTRFLATQSSMILAAALLSGCKSSLPETTDAEIVTLVGGSGGFSFDGERKISKTVLDCAGTLSGLDDDLLKDAGPEMLGLFKTSCRQRLNRFVSDPDRNPLGFELEHFENPELAERIEKIRDQCAPVSVCVQLLRRSRVFRLG